jgi:hypothetical protein
MVDDDGPGVERLLTPSRVYTRSEVLARPSPVPRSPGVYAWYFDEVPPGVPTEGCHSTEAGVLLYVGIAPKEPPRNGKPPSRQTIWNRLRYHYRGNAYGSTLRLTLGCHLTERLGISLRRVGSGTRLTFTHAGEQRLNEWMAEHARVTWVEHQRPWELEREAIRRLVLPLNLQDNGHSAYYAALKALRASHMASARALPVA